MYGNHDCVLFARNILSRNTIRGILNHLIYLFFIYISLIEFADLPVSRGDAYASYVSCAFCVSRDPLKQKKKKCEVVKGQ